MSVVCWDGMIEMIYNSKLTGSQPVETKIPKPQNAFAKLKVTER